MLYLLGGAARAGKSTIARQFLAQTGIPFFCLDYLMMGFANGLPEAGVDPDDDELHVADRLWPILKPMATALVEDKVEYLIEGVQLRPRHVWELGQNLRGHVRACFVGFAGMDTTTKFQEMRRFGGGPDDWLRDYDDEAVRAEIERLKAFSAHLKEECRKYGLKYVEISTDLQETVDRVVQYLVG